MNKIQTREYQEKLKTNGISNRKTGHDLVLSQKKDLGQRYPYQPIRMLAHILKAMGEKISFSDDEIRISLDKDIDFNGIEKESPLAVVKAN